IRECPQIAEGIPVRERLRKVPEFSSDSEASQRMGNRESLAELSSPNCACRLFGEDAVHVEVKAAEVVAHQKQCALPEGADIDLGCWTLVETADVAEAHGRF